MDKMPHSLLTFNHAVQGHKHQSQGTQRRKMNYPRLPAATPFFRSEMSTVGHTRVQGEGREDTEESQLSGDLPTKSERSKIKQDTAD